MGSVTTLAFSRAVSTLTTLSLESLSAKKCWLTLTLSSATQPSVFPSDWRGCFLLPAAGQEALRKLWRKHGYVSLRLIEKCEDVPSTYAYTTRFGRIRDAYRLIGYDQSSGTVPKKL